MKKILFFIPNLANGGAEKVLVNLVNHLDPDEFDITVKVLFPGGVNEQFLKPHIRLQSVFRRTIPGISMLCKPFSPGFLHKRFIRERYDIEVSYHEGISARVISGCPRPDVKTVSWVHVEQHTAKNAAFAFRSVKEAETCYNRFDRIVCVSNFVREDFSSLFCLDRQPQVLYNTVESDRILQSAAEETDRIEKDGCINLVAVGTLKPSKGYERLFQIVRRLITEGRPVRLYVLGEGADRQKLQAYIDENGLRRQIVLLGYDTNPYRYVARCDLFVCASFAEGFSTAATEALIVGTPVCTVDVSGMREMLGEHNEYGVVTDNTEEALYRGIRQLVDDPQRLAYYTQRAKERGRAFDTRRTAEATGAFLRELTDE